MLQQINRVHLSQWTHGQARGCVAGSARKEEQEESRTSRHAAVKAARAGGAKRYDKDMMREARNRVQNGELTIAEAIEEYGPHKVTESTLCRHVRGKSSPSRARGKKPALSPADEDALAEWVITSSLVRLVLAPNVQGPSALVPGTSIPTDENGDDDDADAI